MAESVEAARPSLRAVLGGMVAALEKEGRPAA
jgi:hypothetical protein